MNLLDRLARAGHDPRPERLGPATPLARAEAAPLSARIAERRIERQHAAGVHADCDRTTCEWWSRSEWARRGLVAKEIVT